MLIAFHVASAKKKEKEKKNIAMPNQTKSLASLTLRQPLSIALEPGGQEEADVAAEKVE